MSIQVSVNYRGVTSIQGDEIIVQRAASGTSADVSELRISLDTLGELYARAERTNSADDAATYLAYKERLAEDFKSQELIRYPYGSLQRQRHVK